MGKASGRKVEVCPLRNYGARTTTSRALEGQLCEVRRSYRISRRQKKKIIATGIDGKKKTKSGAMVYQAGWS